MAREMHSEAHKMIEDGQERFNSAKWNSSGQLMPRSKRIGKL